MRNIVASMEQHGIKRLSNLSAWGASNTRPYIRWVFLRFRMTLLKAVFDGTAGRENILFASKLDSEHVSPGRLTDGKQTGA